MPLLLLPNLIGDHQDHHLFLPMAVDAAVLRLDGLIAESEPGGRRYLKRFKTKKRAHEMPIATLNRETPYADLEFLLEPVLAGETWGVISDAGLPCIADPGAALVLRAKQLKLAIEAFSGPSSLFFALMQSGLPGQRFTFHGYCSKEPVSRKQELKEWEMLSKQEKSTHIFIEAPYRNDHTLLSCIEVLHKKTLLCVACDLTMPTQEIETKPIALWQSAPRSTYAKRPALFLLSAA